MKGRPSEELYLNRFSPRERAMKEKMWRCLVEHYLQRFFPPDQIVVDMGCGFCEFINSLKARKKYGCDIEAAFGKHAGPDVEFIEAHEGKPISLADDSCDRVFASNFFEHLSSRQDVSFNLREAFRILKPDGRLIVIQPNISLIGSAYWDFFDHIVPLTDNSLLEAMRMAGFGKFHVKRRFLPYTTKGRRVYSPLLLRAYLALPPLQWIFGKQSLIIAEKPRR